MSTNADDLDNDDADEQEDQRSPVRRRMSDLEKSNSDLQAELANLRREAAFSKALGPALESDPRLPYFVKAYDGELDPAAIRAAANEAGFLAQQGTQQTIPQADLEAHDRIRNASAGASGPGAERLEDAISKAGSMEELLSVMERAGRPTSRTQQ